MKVLVITKKTLFIIAAAIIAFIAAVIVILLLVGSGAKKHDAPENDTRDRNAVYTISSSSGSSLLSKEDEYETAVLAGFKRELPVYSVERSDKKIALTIDAAWDDDKTPFILETLAKYNVKATFFLCGSWVKAYPEMVKAIHESGHEIGNHSMTHPHMAKQSPDDIKTEITELDGRIKEITGESTALFRAPYGEYNDTVIRTVRSTGHEPIQWNIDTIDWKPERSSQTILDTVLPKLKDGSIILCHNNGYKIEEYLPTLIETAQAQGYVFVTVGELLIEGETVIDVNGVQKAK